MIVYTTVGTKRFPVCVASYDSHHCVVYMSWFADRLIQFGWVLLPFASHAPVHFYLCEADARHPHKSTLHQSCSQAHVRYVSEGWFGGGEKGGATLHQHANKWLWASSLSKWKAAFPLRPQSRPHSCLQQEASFLFTAASHTLFPSCAMQRGLKW